MQEKLFGTDGIRGLVNGPVMNKDFVFKIGQGLGRYLRERHPKGEIHVVLGRDTRESSETFEKALIEGLILFGVSVDVMGVLPTPAVSYWVDELEADNGIAITASHNPASYNGIKLFNAHGKKQTETKEVRIEELIYSDTPPDDDIKPGEIIHHDDGVEGYVNHLKDYTSGGKIKDWKVVLDTANGASVESSSLFLEYLGADIVHIGNAPDGKNINSKLGSQYPNHLKNQVKKHNARLGFAHDGDGDRLVVCDESGEIVPGEQLLGVFALHALKNETLKSKTLVTTVQANLGLDKAIIEAGGEVVRVDVGDRNVFQKMLDIGSNIGGEPSGHYVFLEHASTGDALLATTFLIDVLLETNKPLSELKKQIPLNPTLEKDITVEKQIPLKKLKNLNKAIKNVTKELGENGRVLVRYSGTEPLLRILVEHEQKSLLKPGLDTIVEAVSQELNVIE